MPLKDLQTAGLPITGWLLMRSEIFTEPPFTGAMKTTDPSISSRPDCAEGLVRTTQNASATRLRRGSAFCSRRGDRHYAARSCIVSVASIAGATPPLPIVTDNSAEQSAESLSVLLHTEHLKSVPARHRD